MPGNKKALSVLCPSYNHAKYMNIFLHCLLAQTNPNWELIIVDDASTDDNVKEILKFQDSRIKLIQHDFNRGINSALNTAMEHASYDYVAIIGSDDLLMPDYVETILDKFDLHPDVDVIYSDLQCIDVNGRLLDVWKNSKKNKYEILCDMFFRDNVLLSPGMAMRRSSFMNIYPLPIPLSQYQDYKMHVDLLLKSECIILPDLLVKYRKPSKYSGISFFNQYVNLQRKLETALVMDSYLSIDNLDLLKKIFGDNLNRFGTLQRDFIPFYLGMMALDSPLESRKQWGYSQVSDFIKNKKHYELLHEKTGFDYHDFLKLAYYFSQTESERKYHKYKQMLNLLVFVDVVCIIALLMCYFL